MTGSFFLFLLGLAVGSFLNVLIYRIPRQEGFVSGRSRCPKCKKELHWLDLFPVASAILLSGRCRYCRGKISWRYSIVELLTGFSFLGLFLLNISVAGDYLSLVFWLAAISLLIVLIFIDFDYLLIPDKILIVLGSLTVVYQLLRSVFLVREPFLLHTSLSLPANLLTALLSCLVFLAIFIVTKGKGIGLGDVKLVFFLGLMFGFPGILPVIYLALLSGLVWGLSAMVFFGANLKSQLPLGSMLGASAVFFVLFNKIFFPAVWPYITRLYL